MSTQAFCLFTFALLTFAISASSHWWFMSQVYLLGSTHMCNVAGLPKHQQQLCRENPDVMVSIGKGAKTGVKQCQKQMQSEMWNCSTVPRDLSVFGKITRKATRESAFVFAICSAGVVHEVTLACRRGELSGCHCGNSRSGDRNEVFQWGGCSDHFAYGTGVAKAFVDSLEQERDARAKMNLHNNHIGRTTVNKVAKRVCKCHGVSASCLHRTCSRTLAPFSAVGDHLLEKYHNVTKVTVDQKGDELVLADRNLAVKPPRDNLVFLEDSPDYCEPNPDTGSVGTTGRFCNKTTTGRGSCKILCCGRGYNTLQVYEERDCACEFHWCCQVKCNRCRKIANKHVCR